MGKIKFIFFYDKMKNHLIFQKLLMYGQLGHVHNLYFWNLVLTTQ